MMSFPSLTERAEKIWVKKEGGGIALAAPSCRTYNDCCSDQNSNLFTGTIALTS